jgi:tripartite-type tricarboxylate transporter receptor subunit TctC
MHSTFRSALSLFASFLMAAAAHAQMPSKPISFVIPFSAGGHADVVGREIARSLSEVLKQPVIVDNAAGAGGAIAARKVLAAPPDGQTAFLASPSQLILAGIVNRDIKFSAEDFQAIHMVGTSPYVIMARKDLPARNADELAVLAREAARNGTPLTYASVGVGTLNHVLGEDLARRIKAPMTHVPYKGGADVMRDLIGGRIDVFINIYTAQQITMAEQGGFKFVAALSPSRQPLLPQVPSVDEGSALKGFHSAIWTGVFVRKGTPEPVVANLNRAMATVLSNPELQKSLLDHAGVNAAPPRTSLTDVNKEYAAGIDQFRNLAKVAGLQAD